MTPFHATEGRILTIMRAVGREVSTGELAYWLGTHPDHALSRLLTLRYLCHDASDDHDWWSLTAAGRTVALEEAA